MWRTIGEANEWTLKKNGRAICRGRDKEEQKYRRIKRTRTKRSEAAKMCWMRVGQSGIGRNYVLMMNERFNCEHDKRARKVAEYHKLFVTERLRGRRSRLTQIEILKKPVRRAQARVHKGREEANRAARNREEAKREAPKRPAETVHWTPRASTSQWNVSLRHRLV